AVARIQAVAKLVIMTFQDDESGGVALWGIDPESGQARWKTIVGAAWPTPLAPATGSGGFSFFARNGQEDRISAEQLARGGFVVERLPRPGDFALPAGSRLRLDADGKPLAAIVPLHRTNDLWAENPSKPGAWQKIDLPAALAAQPLAWGGGVLIPGLDSRVYLVDPISARSRAEPFVPKFDRDRQSTLRTPALVDRESFVVAVDGGLVFCI